MKKVNFKIALTGLLFAVIFLLGGLQRADAQASALVGVVYTVPQGNFADSNNAQAILQNALINLKADMALFPQGSAPFNAIMKKFNYYTAILMYVKSGQMSVPQAISSALFRISKMVLQSDLPLLKQEAIDLLKI